ncbi:diguanylate cyclase (GGDEF) domain protein [Hoeflea phototrophica DFL-43]|uniref:Diguanylate cyclase (GGDEF) domain protein n=1 Tax=Hoeflea phototrophica (strain DSM 17068 / NCIMB 14078 / DFL-43) TaxID=411684 RepID=A9CX05_HOEPD|nr:EAL domain-containing protein [Hoeflea phototrophica]EDQ35597.2 diguanylate cyclase (GGDEF) domain protein [Hoeflea phototrophica DFL-43]
MSGMGPLPGSAMGRVTTTLVVAVALSILITATLGYVKVSELTATNSAIRIDRAARTAVATITHDLKSEFESVLDEEGRPLAVRLKYDNAETALSFRDEHSVLLNEIARVNQGAANLFKFNRQTDGFDRFATTFRKPDGSMPPPMSISAGHPAYASLAAGKPFLGEVPVMGRLRLAYLTPIVSSAGTVEGALAVDVGWVDDLIVARTELGSEMMVTAGLLLLIVAFFGAAFMAWQLEPIRILAGYADDLADNRQSTKVPFKDSKDEFGALALALERLANLQHRLAGIAYTDQITGLGNRSRYLADLEAAVAETRSGSAQWCLLHLDLDNFFQINDAYGPVNGDKLLIMVGEEVKRLAGARAKLARPASDEFTILVDDRPTADEVAWLAESVLEALRQPFHLPCGEVHTCGSIGIVLPGDDAADADTMHLNAELARRKAKANGGNQAVFFTPELNNALQDQLELEGMLRSAIAERELEVHFQPQINPANHQLVGLEALARWTHPEKGPIPPGRFIPIAESSGQIMDLGSLVFDLACAQAAKWRRDGFDFKHISVNVSPMQLGQANFIEMLKSTLERHNLPGETICIEITESVFVDQNEERIARIFAGVHTLGLRLALDDFGSGYSSLGYLNQLPLEQLKVDRCFVSDIDTDTRKQKVLRGILELARGLGFEIVVEGTETLEEVRMVEAMGCDAVQGYYFARPSPASLVPDMVAKIALSRREPPALRA